MKQINLEGQKRLVIKEVQEATVLSENDVMIDIKVVTICGSDISYFKTEKLPHNLQYPLTLGHEAAGIIRAVGSNVKHLVPGDRVAIEPGSYCGHCEYCQRGEYNFCTSLKFMASKGEQGALRETLVWPAKCVFKLQENISFEEGALLEPLSVAYSAIDKLDFHKDSRVAILGAGSIGMLIGLLMKNMHPDICFYLVDIFKEKMMLGAHVGLEEKHFLIKDTYELKDMKKFTHIIDSTGNTRLVNEFLKHGEQNVTLLSVGVSDNMLNLSFKDIVYQGIHIIGSYRYAYTYPKLLALYEQGDLDVKHIITKSYSYEDAQEAFYEAMDNQHNIKVAIRF